MLNIIVADKIIATYDDMDAAYNHAMTLSRQNPTIFVTLTEGDFSRRFRNGYSI